METNSAKTLRSWGWVVEEQAHPTLTPLQRQLLSHESELGFLLQMLQPGAWGHSTTQAWPVCSSIDETEAARPNLSGTITPTCHVTTLGGLLEQGGLG